MYLLLRGNPHGDTEKFYAPNTERMKNDKKINLIDILLEIPPVKFTIFGFPSITFSTGAIGNGSVKIL